MHEAYHHTHKHDDAQDMRNMGGLRRYMPITWATMWIATLAIAGVWPFAGFFSKDEIIWQVGARAVGPFEPWFRVYWIMALVAALLTAFYMTRLMVMTFHGANRTGDDERKHLHEVSPVMWLPLVVLALFSVIGGWVNVPHAIGEAPLFGWLPHSEWLHEWLHPITEEADAIMAAGLPAFADHAPFGGSEVLWAALSFGLAVAVILIAARVIGAQKQQPAAASPEPRGFAKVLYNKWYVDEIYDAVIVRPVVATSKGLWRFVDEMLIDGVVNGAGYASRAFGWVGSRMQTGQLNTYAFAVVAGALLLLAFALMQ
jgi:NADH-quinone oxidoreductase subunit L